MAVYSGSVEMWIDVANLKKASFKLHYNENINIYYNKNDLY